MEAGDQLTVLGLLIVVLGVAYFGLTAWTKRSGKAAAKEAAGPPGGPGVADDVDMAADLRDAVDSRDQAAKQREKRFNLTGKDAETAAKVLKRMLRQDRE